MVRLLGMVGDDSDKALSDKVDLFDKIGLTTSIFLDEDKRVGCRASPEIFKLYTDFVNQSRIGNMLNEFPNVKPPYPSFDNTVFVVENDYFKQNYRDLKKTGAFKNCIMNFINDSKNVEKYCTRSLCFTTESKNTVLLILGGSLVVYDGHGNRLYGAADVVSSSYDVIDNALDDFCANSLVLSIKRLKYTVF